jgi:signal recognition particle subunit SEC65
MRERDRQRVWAVSLDASRSRARGRRIPKSLAVANPTLSELTQAAAQLGLNPQSVEAAHPRTHRVRSGYITITKQPHKTQTLRRLAQTIAQTRAQARK